MTPPAPPRREITAKERRYRFTAMGVVLSGTFMVVLDTTVVNLGLPAMQRDFGTLDGVEWVVTAYLAAVGVAQVISGWVGDRFGRKRSFVGSLVIFVVGSLLCALSPSLWLLVFARIIQGFGGGLMMPVSMATIYELYEPEERGKALGIFGIAVMAAPAVGPVLGGALVRSLSWHWIFLINVPIGLIAIPVALRVLRDGDHVKRSLDTAGLAMATSGITLFVIGLAQGGKWGWLSLPVLLLLGSGAALLAVFSRHAKQRREPLVDISILEYRVFALAVVVGSLLAIAQYGRLVYIPLELANIRAMDELEIGLVMLPGALGIATGMPLGGRFADRVGARSPVVIGVTVMAASYWYLGHLDVDFSLNWLRAWLFIGGFGSGIALMPPSIVAMNAVNAPQVGDASGLNSVTRQIAAAMGIAALASIFVRIRPDGDLSDPAVAATAFEAFNTMFLVCFGLLVLCIAIGAFLPGKKGALALQAERRAELDQMHRDADLVEPSGGTHFDVSAH